MTGISVIGLKKKKVCFFFGLKPSFFTMLQVGKKKPYLHFVTPAKPYLIQIPEKYYLLKSYNHFLLCPFSMKHPAVSIALINGG